MVTVSELIEKDKKYVLHGWGYSDIIITEAKGATFKDINGKEYLDFLSQTAGVLGVGHTHPKVLKAVRDQLDKVHHTLTMFANEPRIILGEKLASIAPEPLKNNCMTYFACGGTEANETAIKLAMKATGKREVISTFFGYHGGSLGMSSLLGQSWHREKLTRYPGFSQIPNPYCYRCYFGQEPEKCDLECARFLEHHIKCGTSNDVAAFIQEPVQGNGGHQLPWTPEYYKVIREICNKYDVLYISDEVQTGMGRTGKIWGADTFNMKPDIMTTGKALGGGMPVSGATIRADLVPEDLKTAQWHIFTMGGGPILCAAGIAAIDVLLEERLWEKAASMGEYMTKRLKEMEKSHRIIGEVRGPGLFIGVEFVKDTKTKEPATDEALNFFAKCLNKGVLFGLNAKAGVGNIIKIKPPLSVTKEEVDKALDIFEDTLKEIK
ncbi:MAG: aspartate aminotransferase family protein [Candidatus Bathyarchaeia archaeon]